MKAIFLTALFSLLASLQVLAEADLIVLNADVRTADKSFSRAEAFAVKEGRFVEIGSNSKIKK